MGHSQKGPARLFADLQSGSHFGRRYRRWADVPGVFLPEPLSLAEKSHHLDFADSDVLWILLVHSENVLTHLGYNLYLKSD